MTEVESFFKQLKDLPDDSLCPLSLGFKIEVPTDFYRVVVQGEPILKAKEHLFNVMVYFATAFKVQVDFIELKKQIFSSC